MKNLKEIEKSLIKTYRKEIWSKFIKAIKEYELIKEGDKIAVCISGGKDSFLMAKCFQQLNKHSDFNFTVEYIVMNPGYTKENVDKINKNALLLGIQIKIFNSDIFDIVNSTNSGSPCYLCEKIRRGKLYSIAQALGCNKIALGHHFDDVIETTLLNLFYGSEIKTMLPKLHSKNFENMELIRPMYLIKEKDIIRWSKSTEIEFLNCACKFTQEKQQFEETSKRREMKRLINNMLNQNAKVDDNVFKALDNINLESILGYKVDGEKKTFLDNYDN